MAEGNGPKPQFMLRLPPEVLRHLKDRYLHSGVQTQLQALAGLVAFECCGEPLRSAMIQWATRIASGEVAWAELVKAVGERRAGVLDQQKLLKLLDAVARSA